MMSSASAQKRKVSDIDSKKSTESEFESNSPKRLQISSETKSIQADSSSNIEASKPAEEAHETLVVHEATGNIFDAPDGSVLIHACNCQGAWGTGIAEAFRKQYPKACQVYQRYCKRAKSPAKPGTALLISPSGEEGPKHYIGCLFTSNHYGRRKDAPSKILGNTGPALRDLLRQVAEEKTKNAVGELRICQINSGAFNVKWERTLQEMQGVVVEEGMPTEITVWSR